MNRGFVFQGGDIYCRYGGKDTTSLDRSHLCRECIYNQAKWRKYKRITERHATQIDTLLKAYDESQRNNHDKR